MIKTVDEKNIDIAAHIHSESWQESHKSFCNPEFVAKHTQKHQKEYLMEKIKNGTALYMLFDEASEKDVGIVSVTKNLIEDLYVLPVENKEDFIESWKKIIELKPAAIYPAHGKKFDYQDLEKNIKNLEKIKLRRLKY